jgi:hypothetical protein
VIAPFNRYILDAMVDFLWDDTQRNTWLEAVAGCGTFSQTLFHYAFHFGRAELLGYDPPQALHSS